MWLVSGVEQSIWVIFAGMLWWRSWGVSEHLQNWWNTLNPKLETFCLVFCYCVISLPNRKCLHCHFDFEMSLSDRWAYARCFCCKSNETPYIIATNWWLFHSLVLSEDLSKCCVVNNDVCPFSPSQERASQRQCWRNAPPHYAVMLLTSLRFFTGEWPFVLWYYVPGLL